MQNWLLPAAWRVATSRETLRDVQRVNIRTRVVSSLIGTRIEGGGGRGVTCGKEPRSEIVNTFSHSPIFRATTAQPLVKNHASSRLPRIGAPPFRRPLRHSIVRFRAPTTPESRERNDHALCIGACCFADGSCTLRQLCVRSPRSASRFPRTHTFGMPRLDAATLLLHLRKSYTLSGDHPYVLYLVCSFFFIQRRTINLRSQLRRNRDSDHDIIHAVHVIN